MKDSKFGYGHMIAIAALGIKAIKLRTNLKDFFKWAKGWMTPIYNDNRLHLSYPENRDLIIEAAKFKIRELGLKFDAILGTKTSGIPWAVLLADALKVPVIVIDEKIAYTFSYEKMGLGEDYNLIASSSPFGIPSGIRLARDARKGFIYVRAEEKNHGLGNKIEGAYRDGQSVYYKNGDPLMGRDLRHTRSVNDKTTLVDEGLSVTSGGYYNSAQQIDITGMKLLGFEDLISTGGSSLEEAVVAREMGAEITDILALFNYEFPIAKAKADKASVVIHSLSTYDDVMSAAIAENYIKSDELAVIQSWRLNPIEWSNRYGGTSFEQ